MEPKALDNPYTRALAENLEPVRDRMACAAERAGRAPQSVKLVAVTKGHPVDAVYAALQAGLINLGENRVEELASKVAEVRSSTYPVSAPVWHLIGHLQRRKVQAAVGLFSLFHAVDSLRLARKLSSVAEERGKVLEVLVQVNASGEESKGGLPHQTALDELAKVLELPGVRVAGLMTMAPFVEDEHILRSTFSRLRGIHEEARRDSRYSGTELSMGMTNDFEIGIEEGSTLIRLGTALFGERRK